MTIVFYEALIGPVRLTLREWATVTGIASARCARETLPNLVLRNAIRSTLQQAAHVRHVHG